MLGGVAGRHRNRDGAAVGAGAVGKPLSRDHNMVFGPVNELDGG